MSLIAPFIARDGLKLARRQWSVADPRGTVLLVHGIAEHSGRYEHVAAKLNAWGWNVESYDHRGHGLSDGDRGGIPRDYDLVDDLGTVIYELRRQNPSETFVLMGHSMGGLIVGCYAADLTSRATAAGRTDVDAVVMVSPALAVKASAFQRFMMATVGRLLLDLRVRTGFNPETICRDPAVVEEYRRDLLVHDKISARLARFIVEGGRYVLSRASSWVKPTLVVYAGADRIVDPQGSKEFEKLAPTDVCVCSFDEMEHEILNDQEQDLVFNELRSWLDDQFGDQHEAMQLRQVMG